MIVVGGVGIEVGALPADGDFTKQTCTLELMPRIVDCCQRHPLARAHGLLVQQLCRHVPITMTEQQLRQRNTLSRRPQTGPAQKMRNRIGHSTGSAGGTSAKRALPTARVSRNFAIAVFA